MHDLPPHLQAGPSGSTPLPTSPSAGAQRPFYKRKRYVLPAALLLLAMCGQDEDTVVSDRPPAEQAAAPSPTPTFDRARWLAANEATTKDNARAVASTGAAQRLAAEAAAKARAEAEAAARAEAARVAAEQAAAAEAARVAAEQAAAAEAARVAAEQAAVREAARLEAERQAVVQQPTNVYHANCDAVRAAGAAPIRLGDPGYNRKLDRDGDGQGCGAD